MGICNLFWRGLYLCSILTSFDLFVEQMWLNFFFNLKSWSVTKTNSTVYSCIKSQSGVQNDNLGYFSMCCKPSLTICKLHFYGVTELQ